MMMMISNNLSYTHNILLLVSFVTYTYTDVSKLLNFYLDLHVVMLIIMISSFSNDGV